MSKPPREVDYQDVDDVIGIAAEMQNLDQDRLSVEDLEAVAKDIEIPTQYVRPAIEELRRRRAEKLAAEQKKKKTRRLTMLIAGGVLLLLVLYLVIAQRGLASKEAEVDAARAQVKNVIAYRERVRATWLSAPDSPERTAALAGADTRVSRETLRYDDAVRAYNAGANGFPGGLVATLFGMPGEMATSDQVAW
ncbi:MAG: hypothetical protein IT385_01885 [Deltaproteobacteria bacterium]|nr:hypothetical protein [Deltaproteobacteria bacterium]